jgi:hypothetical protein
MVSGIARGFFCITSSIPLLKRAWFEIPNPFLTNHCPMKAPSVYWTVSAAEVNLTGAADWAAGFAEGCWAARLTVIKNVTNVTIVDLMYFIFFIE